MGTRADFYILKKENEKMIWMGSTAWDGRYEKRRHRYYDLVRVRSEKRFLELLEKEKRESDDFTKQSQGWPWPWDNSFATDTVIIFDENDNKVHLLFSRYMLDYIKENPSEFGLFTRLRAKNYKMPDMSKLREGMPCAGERSGFIHFGLLRT